MVFGRSVEHRGSGITWCYLEHCRSVAVGYQIDEGDAGLKRPKGLVRGIERNCLVCEVPMPSLKPTFNSPFALCSVLLIRRR